MAKLAVHQFSLPRIQLTGHPFKFDDTDKLFWVPFEFLGEEFSLTTLKLLEGGREMDVKKVKTQDNRQLLQFKGIPEKALYPGLQLFSSEWPVVWENKAYILPLGAGNKKLNPGKGRVQGKLLSEGASEAEYKPIPGPGDKYLVQVTLKRRVPWLMGTQITLVTEAAGPIECAVLTPGALESRDLQDLINKTFRFPGSPSLQAVYSINLRLRGWILLPPALQKETFEETSGEGPLRIMTKARAFFSGKIISMVSQPGGASKDQLEEKLKLPREVVNFLLAQMIGESKLQHRDGYYLPTGDPRSYLSPLAKGLLDKLEQAGLPGLFIPDQNAEVLKENYRALGRMGLAVVTEEEQIYSLAAYQKIIQTLCAPGTLGREYRIAEMRDLLGLSRQQMLGLLHRLEADGWLAWREDHREVLKEWNGEASS